MAHSRALAQDAADAITVEYDALPPVVNAEKALEPGAPLAREELDSNICFVATKTGGDVNKAFAEAEHIVRLHIASPRLVALALEPRGVLAKPEPTGDLTVWLSTQSPHRVRADLATAIGFPEHRIRVIAPDVGGGFGSEDHSTARKRWLATWRCSSTDQSSGLRRAARIFLARIRAATRP